MANCIKNIVKVEGDINDLPIVRNGIVTFEAMLPTPMPLLMETGSYENIATKAAIVKAWYGSFPLFTVVDVSAIKAMELELKDRDDLLQLECDGLRYISNAVRYGYSTWDKWRRKHWGVEKDAFASEVSGDTASFITSGRRADHILKKISKNLDYPIEHWWADESIGEGTGYAVYYKGSKETDIKYENYSNEAFETHFYCWGPDESLEQGSDGNWHLKE